MVFVPPPWVPVLPEAIADSVTAGQYVLDHHHALGPNVAVKDPFVCALSGKVFNAIQVQHRVDLLARSLARRLHWTPNEGAPFEKVVGVFSVNTIDYVILTWAVHRLGGVCLLLHASSSAAEIATHFGRVPCQAIFTCEPLLPVYSEASKLCDGIEAPVFLLDLAEQLLPAGHVPTGLTTLEQLVQEANADDVLEEIRWTPGQGKTQIAYLCPTSGTSGTQKLAQITHVGLIANITQSITYETFTHKDQTEVGLGFLPFSHIYGLLLAHMLLCRGDSMIIHPQFDLQAILKSVTQYRIERLYLVPPIVAAFVRYAPLLEMFDLSSVTTVVLGAAALGTSLAEALHALRPTWTILPGWGLTEGGGVSTVTSAHDQMRGSSGSLLPCTEVRLVDADGGDVDAHDVPGEIYLRSPSNIYGYLHDKASNEEIFAGDGWLRTGDVGIFRLSPKGVEHLFVVDRVKDLIKVKGMQVAPTELENHLLLHSAVADVAVIGIEDSVNGERPKAFIVLSAQVKKDDVKESELKKSINEHVEAHLSKPHWLGKHIDIVEEIPKSASGKILRRVLKSREASKGSTTNGTH